MGKLKSNGREYEMYVAAVAESCTEETCAQSLFVSTFLSDRLREGRFSSPSKSVDPQNRDLGGDLVL